MCEAGRLDPLTPSIRNSLKRATPSIHSAMSGCGGIRVIFLVPFHPFKHFCDALLKFTQKYTNLYSVQKWCVVPGMLRALSTHSLTVMPPGLMPHFRTPSIQRSHERDSSNTRHWAIFPSDTDIQIGTNFGGHRRSESSARHLTPHFSLTPGSVWFPHANFQVDARRYTIFRVDARHSDTLSWALFSSSDFCIILKIGAHLQTFNF